MKRALSLLLLAAATLGAQQVPDTAFTPVVAHPMFAPGRGPAIVVDEAHHNFHTVGERFGAFAKLMRRDGYVVRAGRDSLGAAALGDAKLLVIANALSPRNVNNNWVLPTPPTLSAREVENVRRWVEGGGALLLISDHMPFPGAIEPLAESFGVRFLNGFALEDHLTASSGARDYLITFSRGNGLLGEHSVLSGRNASERIDSVTSFTGSAFFVVGRAKATPILTLPTSVRVWMPERAWVFSDSTPSVAGGGLLQGAVLEYGKGRVAVFGEAAMFTAQRKGPRSEPMGMNAPIAGQNAQFVMNLVHWLTAAK